MIALEAFGSRPRPVQGQPSYDGRLVVVGRLAGVVRLVLLGAVVGGTPIGVLAQVWPFPVTDLRDRESLTILVFGDGGTGHAGQYRVGHAMYRVCQNRGCDLALMLGDNIYENGIEVRTRDDVSSSLAEILAQFDEKFAQPYRGFERLPGFHFWVSLGNHDYRRNALAALLTYSEFSSLWRFPALHYEVPLLPDWIQIHAVHTDTDVRRDLNGLQVTSIKRALCGEGDPNRWKVLFGHQPVYNSGHHRNDGQEQSTRALLEEPLLLQCGVHLYLAGHAHHQEHLTAKGFEQVIQGAAGKSKGSNRPREDTDLRQRFFSRTFGFAIITLEPDDLRIDFFDVLNTTERARDIDLPGPADIVLSYSWCGSRDTVGDPTRDPLPCASEVR